MKIITILHILSIAKSIGYFCAILNRGAMSVFSFILEPVKVAF